MSDPFLQDRFLHEGVLELTDRELHAATTLAERGLVEQCLVGDQAAWEAIYQHCQPTVLRRIKALLGRDRGDVDVVQEIAARVWHSLVSNEQRVLAKFDPNRQCRLRTYLAAIAEKELLQYLRTERREKRRAVRRTDFSHANRLATPAHFSLELDEFLALLTRRERDFCEKCLLSDHNDEFCQQHFTPQNSWQLRHRIRRKLEQFVNSEPGSTS